MNSHRNAKHVVVLGAGYAGLMAAMRLVRQTDASIARHARQCRRHFR